MSLTWQGEAPPPRRTLRAVDWARAALRGAALGISTFGGLAVLLVLRLVERPLCGARRPLTPFVAQGVCRLALALLGIGYRRSGTPLRTGGALVANHASWLDILALNAGSRVCFVAKSEVADWPGIGWLARGTGTVFIRRERREARAQLGLLAERLAAGHRLVFFPEGTSTDGRRVLHFRATLYEALLERSMKRDAAVQPVSVIYHAPPGEDPRFYAWWGDMDLAPHLLAVLAAPRGGHVEVLYHPPLAVAEHPGRKALARATEAAVRRGVAARL